jgi:hypothetical protein
VEEAHALSIGLDGGNSRANPAAGAEVPAIEIVRHAAKRNLKIVAIFDIQFFESFVVIPKAIFNSLLTRWHPSCSVIAATAHSSFRRAVVHSIQVTRGNRNGGWYDSALFSGDPMEECETQRRAGRDDCWGYICEAGSLRP